MSSYRSYVPWSKSNLGSSYSGSGSSYSGTQKPSDTSTTKPSPADNKYDTSSAGRRYGTTTSTSSPSTTGAGTSTSSYRSSYVPADRSTTPSKYGTSTTTSNSYLNKDKDKYSSTTTPSTTTPTKDTKENDRPSIREKYHMGPALPSTPTTTTSTTRDASDKPLVRDRYGVREDRQSLIDKYSSGNYSSRGSDAARSYSLGTPEKKEEPPTTYASRSLSRTSAAKPEPEPEKPAYTSNTLSPYRLYSRTSSPYSRTNSKDTEFSSNTSTPATTPVSNPPALRFGTTSRYLGSTCRSPVNEKPLPLSVTSPVSEKPAYRFSRTRQDADEKVKETPPTAETKKPEEVKADVETKMVAVVTRGTSPTPPSSSSFLRTRRADLARVIEKTIQRPVVKPEMVDKEIQSDRGDDTARLSRFGSTSRSTVTPWSSYLDRLSTSTSGYSPAVTKYSTRGYAYTRDRDAMVTTTPGGATSPTNEADALVSTVKDTAKDSKTTDSKAIITESKPPIAKKDEDNSTKNTSSTTITKTNDLGLKKTPSVTKVNDLGLKKTPSITKINELGLKKAPSITKVNELGLKRTSSITKVNETGLKKTPSISKKDDLAEKIVTSTTTKSESSVLKPDGNEAEKETLEKSKTVLKKSPSKTKVRESDGKIIIGDISKEVCDITSPTVKAKEEAIKQDTVAKSDPLLETKATSLAAKPPPGVVDESSASKEDITVLKGALAGLIRANSVKKKDPKMLIKADSLSESESENITKTPSPTKKPIRAKSLVKTDSQSESETDQKTQPTTPSKPVAAKLKLKTDSLSESETEQKTQSTTPSKPVAAKLKLKTDSFSESENDQSKLSTSLSGKDPIAAKPKLKKDSLSESENDQSKSSTSSPAKVSATAHSLVKTESLSGSESENKKCKPPSSPSSGSEVGKLKTPPQTPPPSNISPSFKITSPSANRKFLPPPVPKADGVKPSNSQHSLNKDFRKSTKNMDMASSTDAEEMQRKQEQQRKLAMKSNKSTAGSTDVSEAEASEATEIRSKSESSHKPNTSLPNSILKPSSSLKTMTLQVPAIPGQPPSRRSRSGSESSSEESDSSESETSSSSEEDDTSNLLQSSRSPLPYDKNKSLLSTASSKCLASSADESSIADKPPRPPSSPKPKEEAKSFFMRALAPVTNLFKSRTHESGVDSSSENLSEGIHRTESTQSLTKSTTSDKDASKKSESKTKKKNKICRMESGERAWWLDSSSNIPEGVQRIQSSKSISRMSSDSETDSKNVEKKLRKNRIKHMESGERAWWMENNDSIPENEESKPTTTQRHSADIEEPKKNHFIRKQESGERAWWLDSNPNIPEGIERMKSNTSLNKVLAESEKEASEGEMRRKILIRKQESGERAWWLDSSSNIPEGIQRIQSSSSISKSDPQSEENAKKFSIRHQQSGEKAWWMNSSSSNVSDGMKKAKSRTSITTSKRESSDESESSESDVDKRDTVPKFPLEIPSVTESTPRPTTTTEDSGRTSPYDNVDEKATKRGRKKRAKDQPLFISNHTNIDDILGTAATLVDPVMGEYGRRRSRREAANREGESDADDVEDVSCDQVDAQQVRIHDSTAKTPVIQCIRDLTDETRARQSYDSTKLDDTALQLYKDGDYGSYLDLEASINEQHEEFDGFQTNRKNSIVLRTQLSVRVHAIIEKLLNSDGRELRRALFSLKQIFQEDKDLVHEFVQNDGLACLIKVGSEADQNYQNYILRALGQVMLYVDGMNGVMDHNRTVQWLYTLISSKFRLVVKTALKLLLVFVEYVDTNCMLLIKAVNAVDASQGLHPWSNIMRLIKDYDSADTELLIYATTLINKTLNGVPDQDTYYDQVDALEEQGVEGAIQRYMSKQGTDLDLLRQFQIYEAVLHHEDGEEKGTPLRQLDETIRKTLRNRKSPADSLTLERRKSRRHSTGTSPLSTPLKHSTPRVNHSTSVVNADDDETGSSSSRSSPVPGEVPQLNGTYKEKQTGDAGVTPALRRRRERAERQRSFIREQQESSAHLRATLGQAQEGADDENELSNARLNGSYDGSNKLNRVASRKDLTPLMNAVNKLDFADVDGSKSPETNGILKSPWSRMCSKNGDEKDGDGGVGEENGDETPEMKLLMQLKRENTVKDLTQKLASQNILNSPVEEKVISRIGDMSGLISKAKEGLAKSKSKADVQKSPSGDVLKLIEMKKSETELHWEELVSGLTRSLEICDLDFTDLKSDDEEDVLSPAHKANGIPPPPPPAPMPPSMKDGPPPPPPNRLGSFVPPPCPSTPTSFGVNLRHQRSGTATSPTKTTPTTPSKTKKTVKLFWKEVRDDVMMPRQHKGPMIWDELSPVEVDTQKLEHLFESRAKDLITKKQQEMNKTKEIIVLDHKRSNAINIGMTKLPPPRSIKTAIMKMDATIMTREGIEKLLLMLPTEDEQSRIQEAQMANPDTPLGSAEQFLLTLASISELSARLKLWAFKLDYENSEKEIADPLMDLKQGVETLRANKTFRGILSTLLSIGIFLNGNEVKGFQIEYLAKVPEVKDTVHKHSLLHHLCHMVMEKFPDATDLYSEIGAVTRASKVDFDELATNILKMETECKASWDHLKDIAKHDGSTMMKVKMSDFLADCAERIIVLGIVHRRVMCRYHKFLLWLGIPIFRVSDSKPSEFCRIVSEFALEYRTTRERVLQQMEKKANHRERNKTRGKMITEFGKFRTKEDRADAELRQLLGTHPTHASDLSDAESVVHGSLPWRRQRRDVGGRTVLGPAVNGGNMTDGDDEILESLVKTATKAPGTRTTPRERKRTRHADRKSLRRTLKNGLSEEDKQHLAAFIKGY